MKLKLDGKLVKAYVEPDEFSIAADPVVQYMSGDELKKQIAKIKSAMIRAAKEMNFTEAAKLRDEMYALEKMLEGTE
jgi:excinuclease ABC subunit B